MHDPDNMSKKCLYWLLNFPYAKVHCIKNQIILSRHGSNENNLAIKNPLSNLFPIPTDNCMAKNFKDHIKVISPVFCDTL